MRSHGDPGQADPTIDTNKVIHIMLPSGVNLHGEQGARRKFLAPCETYLTAASKALGGGQASAATANQAQLDKYSECMRANGVPDFPDLTVGSNGEVRLGFTPSDGLDPNSPVFQQATTVCAKKTGVTGIGAGVNTTQPGAIVYGGSGAHG